MAPERGTSSRNRVSRYTVTNSANEQPGLLSALLERCSTRSLKMSLIKRRSSLRDSCRSTTGLFQRRYTGRTLLAMPRG